MPISIFKIANIIILQLCIPPPPQQKYINQKKKSSDKVLTFHQFKKERKNNSKLKLSYMYSL